MSTSSPMVLDTQASTASGSSQSGNIGGSASGGGGGGTVNAGHSGMSTSVVQTSGGAGQIRSRITVVCAECKRLKLKCDRRTPCGSCLKRDTVQRCHYSAAAAEKIDVQSLHNRILILEAQLSAVHTNPAFFSGGSGVSSGLGYDRALLAVGQSGSSLAISLDDVASIWLDELDLTKDGIELRPVLYSPFPDSAMGDMLDLLSNHAALFKASDPFPSTSASASTDTGVTHQLVLQLPAEPLRSHLLDQLEATLLMHPCVNFPQFKARIAGMFRWAESEASCPPASEGVGLGFGLSAAHATRGGEPRPSLSFFAAAAEGFAIGAQCWLEANAGALPASGSGSSGGSTQTVTPRRAAAASPAPKSAGGATPGDTKPVRSPRTGADTDAARGVGPGFAPGTPHALHTLSALAVELHTQRCGYAAYDPDYLHALLLRALYLLHAPAAPEIAHELFPLVGRMVNVARMMGLGIDPDEVDTAGSGVFSSITKVKTEEGVGGMTLYEKETRRRLWWDVFYYDLYISDYMDQPPLLSDDAYTTRLPTDVDEVNFGPGSATLPAPHDENPHGNIGYFIQKCRLAQLVKSMKKRTFRDPLSGSANDLSIDSAATFEAEVFQWLADLPDKFKLNMDSNLSNAAPLPPSSHTLAASPMSSLASASSLDSLPGSSAISSLPRSGSAALSDVAMPPGAESPFLIAQRCEIASVANRILLKLFLPFLKNARPGASSMPSKAPQQAVLASVNAAHTIVHAARVLHTVFRHTRPATYVLYSFARTLFDAAVIAAHNTIQQPQSIYARIAMEDVGAALDVLRDPVVSTGRGPVRGGVEGSPSEAVRIIEVLKAKAEVARSGSGAGSNTGMKRKHGEIDDGTAAFQAGFQLPFVGAGVVSAGSPHTFAPPPLAPDCDTSAISRLSGISNRTGSSTHSHSHSQLRAKYMSAAERENGAWGPASAEGHASSSSAAAGGRYAAPKDRSSKVQAHPSIGIRVRTGSTKTEASPQSRRNSQTSRHIPPPHIPPPPPPPPVAPLPRRVSSTPDSANPYRVPPAPTPLPVPLHEPMQEATSTDYAMGYPTSSYGSVQSSYEQAYGRTAPHPPNIYDQYGAGPSNPSPHSAAPTAPAYYVPSPIGYSTPQQADYDAALAGHNILSSMGIAAGTPAMDTSGPSVPSTPQEPRYSIAPDPSGPDRRDSNGASQPFNHAHGQPHGHHQMAMPGQPQAWTDNNSSFPSWDGYTFWKGESS